MRVVENSGGGGGDGCFPTVAKHDRVWMCEVCEKSPASVTCKADAAALCVTCDRDIHSANLLARRHKRIPVVPFYYSAGTVETSTAGTSPGPSSGTGSNKLNNSVSNENINWRIPNDTSSTDLKSIEMLISNTDRLLGFDFPNPTDDEGLQSQFHNPVIDSVVPVQPPPAKQIPSVEVVDQRLPERSYEIDFTKSKINSYKYSYPDQSLSHSVSSSSIDVGVVSEGNSMSDASYPFMLPVNSGVEFNGETNVTRKTTPLSAADRKARVLRYREKRKNRKFEKTIRYASRKAYAETRPRVKGRFSRRTETAELENDRWLFTAEPPSSGALSHNNSYSGEAEYGVVPSF